MYRWSVCPGSVREAAKLPSYSSSYAEEGTEAHDAAAKALVSGKNAWDVCDDADMAEAVQVYLDYVREAAAFNMELRLGGGNPASLLLVEHKFDLSSVHPGCFGTADAVVYVPREKLLVVVDYKHGAGLPVEVKGNPQLDYYALGALLTVPGVRVNTVRKVIVQPRCPHPAGPVRSADVPAVDLLDFRADLIDYARATEDPKAPLVSGDHCRFCPAAGVCPELHAQAQKTAVIEFAPALPYDPAKLTAALGMRDAVKAWLKNVDEFAYREAEAGRCPPGYKLVAKRATRQWVSEGDAMEWCAANVKEGYIVRSLKSPAQIEAIVGKKKLPAELVSAVSSGKTLVPASDPRPLAAPTAASEFTAIK